LVFQLIRHAVLLVSWSFSSDGRLREEHVMAVLPFGRRGLYK